MEFSFRIRLIHPKTFDGAVFFKEGILLLTQTQVRVKKDRFGERKAVFGRLAIFSKVF